MRGGGGKKCGKKVGMGGGVKLKAHSLKLIFLHNFGLFEEKG